jgi:cell division transport system ATP-binding protein
MTKKELIKYENVDLCQQELTILRDITLEFYAGEFTYLLGKVGSGKSTFLKSLYKEVQIAKGSAEVLSYDLTSMKSKEIPFLRRKIGIVFQDFQLLIDRTVNENLEFVLRATGWTNQEAINEQIQLVLTQVGIPNKGYKRPHQLSGGEQQRVGIARALLNSPEIILADEPTGHLDPDTGSDLMELLYGIRLSGTTVIVATHNYSWIDMYPGRVILVEDERLRDYQDSTLS